MTKFTAITDIVKETKDLKMKSTKMIRNHSSFWVYYRFRTKKKPQTFKLLQVYFKYMTQYRTTAISFLAC